jgi:protein-disulfide isomerase
MIKPKLIITAIAAIALAAAAGACQRDDASIKDKLDQIDKRLASIEGTIARVGIAGGRGAAGQPQQRQRPQPRPNETYSVPVDGAPIKGSKTAKVTVVKAFEFACPYCEKVRGTMDQLIADYGSDVRVVYKHYVVHPQNATIPALAACAAHRQGKFPEMEKLIWDKGYSADRNLSRENMVKLAQEAGLDMDRFGKDLDGQECAQIVRKDQAELTRVGVSGTPAFYINGRFLSGARPIDQFKAVVDEELEKANERIAKGEATVASYYDKFVVAQGKKQLDAR